MTEGHLVGTRLKRSVKAARLKQKLLFQPIRLTIELNTKSELKAWTSVLIYTLVLTEFDRSTRGRSFGQTRD